MLNIYPNAVVEFIAKEGGNHYGRKQANEILAARLIIDLHLY